MPRGPEKQKMKSKPKPSFADQASRSPIFRRSRKIPRPIIVEESSDSEIELNPSTSCADMPEATPIENSDAIDRALEEEAENEFSEEIPEEVLAACTPKSSSLTKPNTPLAGSGQRRGTPMRNLSNFRAKLVSDVS